MICCNNNCNQGRNCPARVAPIGQCMHDREPEEPSAWRRQLKYLACTMAITLAVMLVSALTVVIIR